VTTIHGCEMEQRGGTVIQDRNSFEHGVEWAMSDSQSIHDSDNDPDTDDISRVPDTLKGATLSLIYVDTVIQTSQRKRDRLVGSTGCLNKTCRPQSDTNRNGLQGASPIFEVPQRIKQGNFPGSDNAMAGPILAYRQSSPLRHKAPRRHQMNSTPMRSP
jgi:hypothetical protein